MVGGPSKRDELVEGLRSLFEKGEYEAVITRADRLLCRGPGLKPGIKSGRKAKGGGPKKEGALAKQKSGSGLDEMSEKDRVVVMAARAAALVMVGRAGEALGDVEKLVSGEKGSTERLKEGFLEMVRPYAMWKAGVEVEKALGLAKEVDGEGGKLLLSQILYRLGRYGEASQIYEQVLKEKTKKLDEAREKKRRGERGRFGFGRFGRGTGTTSLGPVAAEIEELAAEQVQAATNLSAALVLEGRFERVKEVKEITGRSYEMEYNLACGAIEASDWDLATASLEKAEALCRAAAADSDEDDLEATLAPIFVQQAYLLHQSGESIKAEKLYSHVIESREADTPSLAVATNNLTVSRAQLLLHQRSSIDKGDEERERLSTIVEGVKKMKAAAGWSVEQKLTERQRRAMARNRAILLAHTNRNDSCRAEVDRLKDSFDNDPVVAMIEAALVAKTRDADAADEILISFADKNGASIDIGAARAQLAFDAGKPRKAAAILKEAFGRKPAALATVAALLEMAGDIDEAAALLEGETSVEAQRFRADMLLRAGYYQRAAKGYRKVLDMTPKDTQVLGHLIIATSYIDVDEAERLVADLPSVVASADEANLDIEALEASQPPRRGRARSSKVNDTRDSTATIGATMEEKKKMKKKKRKKRRLPKDYDPNGPPPDPERWLPKTLRASYKKKKRARRRDDINFKGSQGADAAAAEAAAQAARKPAARATASAINLNAPARQRPKGARKGRRRR